MTKKSEHLFVGGELSVAQALHQCVAETVVTTMMAQNFHWNVTGMAFGPLHTLFQEIYEDHFIAQDDLAERIRSTGNKVDGRLSIMIGASKVTEDQNSATMTDSEMIESLLEAERVLAGTLSGASDVAAESGDKLTEDLCIARGRVHEKFAWMLASYIGR